MASLNNPDTIELPDDWSEPIPMLNMYYGFSCNACRYLTISPKNITHHWRKSQHSDGRPQYSAVQLQTWMPRRYARYWIVRARGDDNGVSETMAIDGTMDKMIMDSKAELLAEDTKRNEKGDTQEGIDYDYKNAATDTGSKSLKCPY
ncbi:hypothetical protein PT974_04688 [Cladobotryum mycophilum]|uniref:C2H2-type domain-containing protein n=1 Tax=Cladobotryum mycophilum TaxID=491253 RepID=A0ABR0SSJ3_9HYPO